MPLFNLFLKLFLKFITEILNLDPEEITLAEAVRHTKKPKFKSWHDKQKFD